MINKYNIYLFDNNSGNENGRRQVIKAILDNSGFSIEKFEEEVFENNRDCSIKYDKDKCKTCDENIEFYDIQKPFILFIHASNACFYRFVKELLESLKDDEGNSYWIVCYSGSDKSDAYNELNKEYTNNNNIKFSPKIGALITNEQLNNKWNIKAFVEAVIKNEANPFDKLVNKIPSYLIALSILCQGYLVAHEKIDLPDNLGKLKETIKSKAGITEDVNDWWLPVIGGNTKSARDELSNRNGKKVVKDLLDAIDEKNGKNLTGEDGIQIVMDANKALPKILKGNP